MPASSTIRRVSAGCDTLRPMSFDSLRTQFLGLDTPTAVTSLSGAVTIVPHCYLDSGATCLMPESVLAVIKDYLNTACANSHTHGSARGRATTAAMDRTRVLIKELVGADSSDAVVFLGSGSTGPLNLLADLLGDEGVILVSAMEHHSDMLPWMKVAKERVAFFATLDDGTLDMASLSRALAPGDVKVVCVSAMSNVTGVITPLHRIAAMAHDAGAVIVVDASQAAPHIKLNMSQDDLDFLVLSGHKLYAPGSPGVLVGRSDLLLEAAWEVGAVGGGIVQRVDLDTGVELLKDAASRLEAGTPDIPGIVSLGAACLFIRDMTMAAVRAHEVELTTLALAEFAKIQNVVVYGPLDPRSRGGIVSFNIFGVAHGLVCAVLNDFYGISVRNDCFCAQPYVRAMLDAVCNQRGVCAPVAEGTKRGMVRMSFGPWTNETDVRKLIDAVKWIDANVVALTAQYSDDNGTFTHKTFRPALPFNLDTAFARTV